MAIIRFNSNTQTKSSGLQVKKRGKKKEIKPEAKPEEIRVATLPPHLGGGSYNIGPDKSKIYKSPRGNAGVTDKDSQTQADHLFPVSLGGASRKDNLRLVNKKDNPADIEAQLARDVESGKITLGQARVKISVLKQQRDNPLPTQNLWKNFGKSIGDLFYDNTGKSVLERAADEKKKKEQSKMEFKVGENLFPEDRQRANLVVAGYDPKSIKAYPEDFIGPTQTPKKNFPTSRNFFQSTVEAFPRLAGSFAAELLDKPIQIGRGEPILPLKDQFQIANDQYGPTLGPVVVGSFMLLDADPRLSIPGKKLLQEGLEKFAKHQERKLIKELIIRLPKLQNGVNDGTSTMEEWAEAANILKKIDKGTETPADFKRVEEILKSNTEKVTGFKVKPIKKEPEFEGFEDLTTTILEKLKGKTTVSKQFISDLTNSGSLKQVERDLIRDMISQEGDIVNVSDFANKVKTELLPLEVKSPNKHNTRNPIDNQYRSAPSRYESITLPDELRGNVANYKENIYESPLKTSAGDVHFSGDTTNYFAHSRIEDLANRASDTFNRSDLNTPAKLKSHSNDTRRVIEIQSDLFQKGRLGQEQMDVIRKDRNAFTWQGKQFEVLSRDPETKIVTGRVAGGRETKIPLDAFEKENAAKFKDIAKLEPFRNTWHERVIKEEIKQAAKEGKKFLQFPTGETAMKIEGLGETNTWVMNDTGRFGNTEDLIPEKLKVGRQVFQTADDETAGTNAWIITEILGDGKFKAMPKEHWDSFAESGGLTITGEDLVTYAKHHATENFWRSEETFDISGKVDTNNPIYKFYEKEVAKYLKRIRPDVKLITDDKGVTWNQINILPSDTKRPVEAFGQALKGFDPKNPEAGFIKAPNIMDTKLGESLYPIKTQDEAVKTIAKNWDNTLKKGKELANQELETLKIPNEQGMQTILDYQAGKPTPYTQKIKDAFNSLFKEANERGQNVRYIENYLPQVYDNTPKEIKTAVAKFLKDKNVPPSVIEAYMNDIVDLPEDVVKHLKLNPSYTKTKTFPDYKTAMEYGLTPKYTNPAQLLAQYRLDMETTIANREFLDKLISKGKVGILEAAKPDWKPIQLPFSPKGYYADPKLADMINGIFRDENTLTFGQSLVKYAAKTAGFMQDLVLSAGVPKSSINFFSIGQTVKEITSGNFKSIKNFATSNHLNSTIKVFKENAQEFAEMAERGVNVGQRIGEFETAYKNLAKNKKVGEVIGDGWHKLFNEKTFNSLMPLNYLTTYKNAKARFIRKGMSADEAKNLAAEVVKINHGLLGFTGRSKTTEDTITTTILASKFREGMINFFGNSLKSVTTEIKNPAYYMNRRFVIGATLTYAGYNALNYKLNGTYLWDNEPGKEFELRIPVGDNIIYVPFLPSMTALPRSIASGTLAFVKGDAKTAGQKLGSIFSMPIKATIEGVLNKDYFGNEIRDPDTSKTQQLIDLAKHFGLNYNHPYVRGVYEIATEEKPFYQILSKMLELPLKFSTIAKSNQARMIQAAKEKTAQVNKSKEKFRPTYDEIRELVNEGKTDEAQQRIESLTDVEYELYKSLRTADKRKETSKKEAEIYPIVERVDKLLNQGKDEEAMELINSLTDEQYETYKAVREKTR